MTVEECGVDCGCTEGQCAFRCGHCGRDGVGTYARGYGYAGGPLCHPNDDGPDCYRLVTVYDHPAPCDCDGSLRRI